MRTIFFYIIFCTSAHGFTLYSETSVGSRDLPDVYTNSLLLITREGSNTLEAQTILGQPDFFTLRIGTGLQLENITVVFYDHALAGNTSFLGFQKGTVFDRDPNLFRDGDLTYMLFSATDEDQNILARSISPQPETTTPLVAGDYAFWLNELEPDVASFTLDFVTVAIPEPHTSILFLMACMATFGIRKRLSS